MSHGCDCGCGGGFSSSDYGGGGGDGYSSSGEYKKVEAWRKVIGWIIFLGITGSIIAFCTWLSIASEIRSLRMG